MAGNFLNIGISGLLSSQSAINTASHNIANVNTEGFSRQRAEIDSRSPLLVGGNYLGTGAELGNVKRIVDLTVNFELQANLSAFNELDTYLTQASRVDGLLADASTGVSQAVQTYFSALQSVANDPTSIAARQVMLSQSDLLTSRFQTLYSQFSRQSQTVNDSIETAAQDITGLGQVIADLNIQIAAAGGSQGEPNDLLDQRDIAINKLSELIDISTVEQNNGFVNVFVGTGQALVVGASSNQLVSQIDPVDPQSRQVLLQSGVGSTEVTQFLEGGTLGGLLRFKSEILDQGFNTVGRVALGIADTINEQHQLGMDLQNNLGGLFFNDINSSEAVNRRVISSTANTGNAVIGVTIDDVGSLSNANYEVRVNAGNYIVTNLNTNSVVANFAVPPVLPTNVAIASEGITLNFQSGVPVDGDEFQLLPTRDGAANIELALSDPTQIAAAAPVFGQADAINVGNGTIKSIVVSDVSTAQFTTTPQALTPPIVIEFLSTTSFNVLDAGTNAVISGPVAGYVPNNDNDMLALAGLSFGYEVTLNGAPQVGDRFNIDYNTDGFGDNRNILDMGLLQQAQTLDNGSSSYQDAFGRLVSDIGSRTQESRISFSAQESLLNQAQERRNSISGVSLDEEAANLIRYEQAYQASAQIITVARTLFQTIIDSTR